MPETHASTPPTIIALMLSALAGTTHTTSGSGDPGIDYVRDMLAENPYDDPETIARLI